MTVICRRNEVKPHIAYDGVSERWGCCTFVVTDNPHWRFLPACKAVGWGDHPLTAYIDWLDKNPQE